MRIGGYRTNILAMSLAASDRGDRTVSLGVMDAGSTRNGRKLAPAGIGSSCVTIVRSDCCLGATCCRMTARGTNRVVCSTPRPISCSKIKALAISCAAATDKDATFAGALRRLGMRGVFTAACDLAKASTGLFRISATNDIDLGASNLVTSLSGATGIVTGMATPNFCLRADSSGPGGLKAMGMAHAVSRLARTCTLMRHS